MFTVVTGFFNIERHTWDSYNRNLEEYLLQFTNLLSLNVNMIIYTEPSFVELIQNIRNSKVVKTTIIQTSLKKLHMYQYLDRITEIQNNSEYAKDHPNKSAPEICKPLYNIVTCSKMDMLAKATKYDPDSEYFIWLDAGYTHNTIDLSTLDWNPTRIFQHKDKMAVISLQSLAAAKDDPKEFFLQYIDVIIGGFFGGYRDTIIKVRNLYYNLVLEMFDLGLKDDDQFYNTILAKRHPELFKVYVDNWYGSMYFD